jgi:predicted enzyme related to lactoylglutathione lyase
MLRSSALVGFVGVTDLDRAKKFYGEALGLVLHDESPHALVDELTARAVTFTHYDGMGQDERGIWTALSGAKIAWFLDPDGNNLSLTQFES